MPTWRSLLLLALAAPMLILAGALGAALLWFAWPPSDPAVDFRPWLVVVGLIAGAVFLAYLAVRARKPHGPWLDAEMLPYPMNDEG